jgi:hypothetical protein
MGGCFDRSKPELSTLLESGTFYFAPTPGPEGRVRDMDVTIREFSFFVA